MKKVILIVLVFHSINLFSQKINTAKEHNYSNNERQINFIMEIGGNGMGYSFGLEHAKFDGDNLKNTIRWGLSFIDTYSACGEFNFDFGKNKNYFELGFGPTIYWNQGMEYFLYARIGYRFNSDHFIFRIGFTPSYLLPINNKPELIVWSVTSFGISFGVPLNN